MPFEHSIWPEEPAPRHAVNCQLCELSGQRTRVVWGEGNPDAPIIVLLDNPGSREDRQGHPFVCGTRKTLQNAAYEAGLTVRDLYVTYILKCRPLRKYDKEQARQTCRRHLNMQLLEKKPDIVFCLGNVATQSFMQDPTAEVKQLRSRWHTVDGFLTAVSYHPLAVRRRPNLYKQFAEDWNFVSYMWKSIKNN